MKLPAGLLQQLHAFLCATTIDHNIIANLMLAYWHVCVWLIPRPFPSPNTNVRQTDRCARGERGEGKKGGVGLATSPKNLIMHTAPFNRAISWNSVRINLNKKKLNTGHRNPDIVLAALRLKYILLAIVSEYMCLILRHFYGNTIAPLVTGWCVYGSLPV